MSDSTSEKWCFGDWWAELNGHLAEQGTPDAGFGDAKAAYDKALSPEEAATYLTRGQAPTRAEQNGVDPALVYGDEYGEPGAPTLAQRWIGDTKAQSEAGAYYSPYCATQTVGVDDTAELSFPDGSFASCEFGGGWVAKPLSDDTRRVMLTPLPPPMTPASAALDPAALESPDEAVIHFAAGDLARLQVALGYFIRQAPARELLSMGDLGEWDALAAALEAARVTEAVPAGWDKVG